MVELPPLVFGAGALNATYDQDPELGDVAEVLGYALEHGITAIDTATLYGRSEEIVGNALRKLGVPRESYTLCTKCCRSEDGVAHHSREAVQAHFARSLRRLHTDYVDVLYIHDVEFSSPSAVLEAVAAAFELKDQGKALNIGISGLPLDVLLKAANLVREKLGRSLDAVLSYCNMTLHCDLLLEYKPKLEAAGVKTVVSASPLAMSLLRSQTTHSFVPAQKELLERADKIAAWLHGENVELADVALQYAFATWPGAYVIGLRTIAEIKAALANREKGLKHPDQALWSEVQRRFGEWHNVIWEEEVPKESVKEWRAL